MPPPSAQQYRYTVPASNLRDMRQVRATAGDSSWFSQERFGLFIHWGIYALPARHEWVKQIEQLDNEQYQRYFDHFDPDLYDPDAWASAAADAGMKYFVVTTKHHDGFCLFDSKLTDYKAPNTPAKRDLIAPMVEAFRNHGLRAGFYHSLIDWHHPEFVVDDMHALRNRAERSDMNRTRDQLKYAEYLRGQVEELLTGYGKIDALFFDFSYSPREGRKNAKGEPFVGKGREDWDSEKLLALVRKLQPHILVNDRLDLMEQGGWDYKTPEQYQPMEWVTVNGERVVWEACQTFSGSWGYHRDEESWKGVDQLIQMLVDTVSKGGNLLLNVGPTGRGEFDYRALERLRGIGEWMKRHSRSIYGCTEAPAEFQAPKDCRLTYNSTTNRLYLHVFAWPSGHIHMPGFAGKIEYAQLLNDASEIRWSEHDPARFVDSVTEGLPPGMLMLSLPIKKPNGTVPVIELFLRA